MFPAPQMTRRVLAALWIRRPVPAGGCRPPRSKCRPPLDAPARSSAAFHPDTLLGKRLPVARRHKPAPVALQQQRQIKEVLRRLIRAARLLRLLSRYLQLILDSPDPGL
jgi:hypothetical protein